MHRKTPKLVTQYLENISREALVRHFDVVTGFVGKRNGVYALFKKGKLYYVGLASNLRGRLRTHLKDRHGVSWDSFSVYLTIGDKHMRELESLIVRIVEPPGNKQLGKFAGAEDIARRFGRAIGEKQRQERDRYGPPGTPDTKEPGSQRSSGSRVGRLGFSAICSSS